MFAMFGTAVPTLIVFPQERPVFLREYSTNHYSVFAYFLSRLTLEGSLTAIQMLTLVRSTGSCSVAPLWATAIAHPHHFLRDCYDPKDNYQLFHD